MDATAIDFFLANARLPKLSVEAKNSLDSSIKLEEINKVISQLPNNKCAGPDGFSAEFYKKFHALLSPKMLRMINHSVLKEELPPT